MANPSDPTKAPSSEDSIPWGFRGCLGTIGRLLAALPPISLLWLEATSWRLRSGEIDEAPAEGEGEEASAGGSAKGTHLFLEEDPCIVGLSPVSNTVCHAPQDPDAR
mmetsp:Transcript_14423/g.22951  ORF Transcript_14423/g.22951 Transcript_14423/m.22951 type:complete len:107 (+) Transcript_14423:364-684(+)